MASSSVSHQGKLASRPAAGWLRQRHLRCSRGLPLCRACHHHHHTTTTTPGSRWRMLMVQQLLSQNNSRRLCCRRLVVYFLFFGLLLLLRLRLVCLPVVLEIWECLQRDSRREQSPVFFPPSPPPPCLGREGGKTNIGQASLCFWGCFLLQPQCRIVASWCVYVCFPSLRSLDIEV